jgi:hypothetical protein
MALPSTRHRGPGAPSVRRRIVDGGGSERGARVEAAHEQDLARRQARIGVLLSHGGHDGRRGEGVCHGVIELCAAQARRPAIDATRDQNLAVRQKRRRVIEAARGRSACRRCPGVRRRVVQGSRRGRRAAVVGAEENQTGFVEEDFSE